MKTIGIKRIFKKFITISVLLCLICFVCVLFVGCDADVDESNIGESPTVEFFVQYFVTDGGSLYGDVEQTVEKGTDARSILAVPTEGYEFVGWSDGMNNINRTDKNVHNDISVTAVFRRKVLSVTYDTDNGGVLYGYAEQSVEYGNDAQSIVAMPKDSYEFVGWSDGITTPLRKDKNVSENISVTAVFKRKYYVVTYKAYGYYYGGSLKLELSMGEDSIQHVAPGENCKTVKVGPIEGYDFVEWSDGNKDPERTDCNITDDATYTAIFECKRVSVEYHAGAGGDVYIINKVEPMYYGFNSSTVVAKPDDGYVFICWSDGLETAERTEHNVTCDLEFTAYFGYSVEYKVNNDNGGIINGKTCQAVLPGEEFEPVEAVPNAGYAFAGWSDLQWSTERHDISAERCVERIAYFEPTLKTFNYDYGIASGIPMEGSVTINRENIRIYGYPTPAINGYTFEGWYADKEYKTKVIDGGGRYMLGYYGFTLGTDKLYARWKPAECNDTTFKILLIFVNEIEAQLYPTKKGGDGILRDVHQIMTSIEREFCSTAHSLMYGYLSDWLSDLTSVEIDAYYSVQAIGEDCISYYRGQTKTYSLNVSRASELAPLCLSYNSVLTVFGLNDHDRVLAQEGIAGTAVLKYANIFLEEMYSTFMAHSKLLQNYLHLIKTDRKRAEGFVYVFVHEFIHTCEMAYREGTMIAYHDAFFANYTHVDLSMDINRRYLLCEIEYNGEICGIPRDFWTDVAYKTINWAYLEAMGRHPGSE